MPIVSVQDGFEDRHVFVDPAADPGYRESLAYLLPMPEEGLGLIYYTWVHAVPPENGPDDQGRAGAMIIAYGPALDAPIFSVADGVAVPDSLGFDDWKVGPAALTLASDMMSGSLIFDNPDVGFDVSWQGLNEPFAFVRNRNGCPSWLADDRTEQGVHYRGSLRINGQHYDVDHAGHRDHSWGMRDWGGATHWKWWNILGQDGTAIHVMELQAFGTTTVHGYVHKDGVIGTVLSFDPVIRYDDRFMQTEITADIMDDEGRTTRIHTTKGADLHWPVSDHLTLHEASMNAVIDGSEQGVGYMEMAWPPAYVEHHRVRGDVGDDEASGLTIDSGK